MRPLLAPALPPTPLPAEAGQAGGEPTARADLSAQDIPANDVPGAALSLCAVALACALQVNFGQYHPLALTWLTVALLGTVLCVAKPTSRIVAALEARRTLVFGLALSVQFVLLLTTTPGATGRLAEPAHLLPLQAAIACAAIVCLASLRPSARHDLPKLLVLLTIFAATGLWALHAAPNPGVDVVLFQRDAAAALLTGENPYATTFPDPYPSAAPFYGPGVSVNGRLQFGYPYPPLGLLLTVPAHLLGDFRYAHLLAMTAAAALIALARPGNFAFAAAALLLFTPRGFFVLEAGWTEPLAVLCLAAVVFAACRSRRSVPVALGCLLAVKQYLVLALLLAPLLPGRRSGLAWKALVFATVVTLPWALWDQATFVNSVVTLQFHQPFRPDALSYLVPLMHLTGHRPPAWIAFVAAGAAALLALRKCPRTPAGFSLALALVLFAFFAFNKQAFCNYYHLVIAALCCAAGASESRPCPRPDPSHSVRSA